MLLFHSILTFMKDLYQSENQIFNPTRLLVLLHCWVGKDWAGPFFPPSKIFRSFYWSVTIVVFLFMLLFHCILTLINDRFQRENQVFKPNILFVLLHCGVGKDLAGPFFLPPPPPPHPSKMFWSFYLSFSLSVNVILLLYLKTYEWLDNQIFKPKSLLVISLQSVPTFVFYLSELILPNSRLGKDWVDFPLTHSNNHFELRTYSFCFLNRLTIYNQILLHPLHFCAVLRVVEL